MTSKTANRSSEAYRRQAVNTARKAQAHRQLRRRIIIAAVVLTLVAGAVAMMMVTSRPTSSAATRTAPDFTLTDTSGQRVNLAAYRGRNVVIYFSEGAGCGACLQQMGAIEKDKAAFDAANVTVLPVVMNSRQQILSDMASYGVKTPFLLDDGTVSKQYQTLGQGMHAGLPGHGFVLIDKNGVQRWQGEYPSMWLDPRTLLNDVNKHLST